MEFKLKAEEIKKVTDLKGGCVVSNKVTVEGKKVGYLYREVPSENFNDSGWRIFAGDEDDEYCDNAENFNIFELNTVCNYDKDIISLLESSVGTAFERDEDGNFVERKSAEQ